MDKKRSEFIGLRLSEKEAELLRERTISKGLSSSAYMRKLLLDDVQGKEKVLSPAAISDKRLSTALAIKTRFKKLASQYTTIANLVQQNLKQANEAGTLTSDTDDVIRSFRSMENISLELQRSFNEYFSLEGVKQELPVYRRTFPDITENHKSRFQLSKYTYMEKIEIIGKVDSEMNVYKDKYGNEKVKIEVVAQAGKTERKYVVFALRNRLPETVEQGAFLFAKGDYDIQGQDLINLYADTVKIIP